SFAIVVYTPFPFRYNIDQARQKPALLCKISGSVRYYNPIPRRLASLSTRFSPVLWKCTRREAAFFDCTLRFSGRQSPKTPSVGPAANPWVCCPPPAGPHPVGQAVFPPIPRSALQPQPQRAADGIRPLHPPCGGGH